MSEAINLADQFFRVHQLLYRGLDDAMNAEGLSLSKHRLLALLHRSGPLRSIEIAEKIGISPRSVTEAIDALERDQLAKRIPDKSDRRARLVAATPAGMAAAKSATKLRARVIERTFGALGDSQKRLLGELLATLEKQSRVL